MVCVSRARSSLQRTHCLDIGFRHVFVASAVPPLLRHVPCDPAQENADTGKENYFITIYHHNNNNNNNSIYLFREDNILSIAYLTYGPLQVKQYNYLQISYIHKD